ncbi:putative Bax inhibitor 1 [Trichoplax sp. H2]|uniref:Bax inhibitor 1 n=1 Tax=Trichoplax adhaerens TaxID=10228 RepID=B3RRU1_TRIAD|nr:expressed hypothetical protein [Trichoplax adhaerens]EDV26930.1 expressed hypothetical protein [Trichoplax adhaerens]RDD43767.1 putative Bax inhibitor 1 [Trichoplax sp. H2]|eukprot:XP_002110926.1 expressed hypothetical protein [Trichoplax adhaerens]
MDAVFGQRPINLKALTTFSNLNAGSKKHLKSVYSCLIISMIAAGAGSMVHLYFNFIKGGLLSCILSLGFLLLLGITPHDGGKTQLRRLGYLCGFSLTAGLGLGPLLEIVLEIDPSIIPTAFLATTLIFVGFTLSALWAEERKYLYMGGTLMSLLSTLCFLGFLNIFLGSQLLFNINLYMVLFVMCGFVLYDTQLIVYKFQQGDQDYIWHSVDLFLDFINIFRQILIILAKNNNREKKRKE